MNSQGFTIEIKTVSDLRAAKSVEQSLQQQIMAAKAAGAAYGHLKTQLDSVRGAIANKGFFGRATSELLGMAEQVPVVGSLMRSMNGGVGLLSMGLVALGAAAGVAKSALSAFSKIEDLQTSFVTLLGSVEKAKQRMADLSKFAAETPFELPEVAQASKVLENLTSGALSTGAGLRMVGDVAAAANAPFAEVAITMGRLYQGMRDGTPVGEAAARMTELTGINLRQVKSWDEVAKALGKYNGEMSRRSATVSGKESTLSDSFNMLMVQLGRPIAPAWKNFLTSSSEFLDNVTKKLSAFIDLCERNSGAVNTLVGAVKTLATVFAGKLVINTVVAAMNGFAARLAATTTALAAETAALTANTAAQAANSSARAGGGAARGKSAAPSGPAFGGAPYSKDAYDSARKMGMPAQQALEAARRAMWQAGQEAGKAAPLWTRLGGALAGGLGKASAGLEKFIGGLFTLPNILAATFAKMGVDFMLSQAKRFGYSTLGGATDEADQAKADEMRLAKSEQYESFAERVKNVKTQDERDALAEELAKTAQEDSQGIVSSKDAGAPRAAQNLVLKNSVKNLSLLVDMLGRKEGLLSPEEVALEAAIAASRERIAAEDARKASLGKGIAGAQEKAKFDAMTPQEQVADLQRQGVAQNETFQSSSSTDEEKATAEERMVEIYAEQLAIKEKIAQTDKDNAAARKKMADDLEMSEAVASGDKKKIAGVKWKQDYANARTAAEQAGMTEADGLSKFAIRNANASMEKADDPKKPTPLPDAGEIARNALSVSSMARIGGAVGESMQAAGQVDLLKKQIELAQKAAVAAEATAANTDIIAKKETVYE